MSPRNFVRTVFDHDGSIMSIRDRRDLQCAAIERLCGNAKNENDLQKRMIRNSRAAFEWSVSHEDFRRDQ